MFACLCWDLDAELTLEPNSPHFFTGESVTFKCDVRGGNDSDWHYKFSRNGQQIVSSTNTSYSLKLTADLNGDYEWRCSSQGLNKFDKTQSQLDFTAAKFTVACRDVVSHT